MGLALRYLESRLWSAANALRGPVDPADFKTYVFPILFWKWISDSWTRERSRAVAEYGSDVLSQPSDKAARREVRSVLKKYALPVTGALFDNAYAYIRENY